MYVGIMTYVPTLVCVCVCIVQPVKRNNVCLVKRQVVLISVPPRCPKRSRRIDATLGNYNNEPQHQLIIQPTPRPYYSNNVHKHFLCLSNRFV